MTTKKREAILRVAELMTRDVHTCRPTDTMAQAAWLMWQRDCGVLPVSDETGKILGMVTDRDLAMAACLTGAALGAMEVRQAMSHGTLCCRTEDTLEKALRTMAEGPFRRLPVIDEKERLIGLLSLADVVQAVGHAETTDTRTRQAWIQDVLATLIEVTRPRPLQEPERAEAEATARQPGRELTTPAVTKAVDTPVPKEPVPKKAEPVPTKAKAKPKAKPQPTAKKPEGKTDKRGPVRYADDTF